MLAIHNAKLLLNDGSSRVLLNDGTSVLLLNQQDPTANSDWNPPPGPRRSVSLYTFTYLALALTATTQPPFNELDWTNPQRRAVNPDNYDWSDSFKLPLTTVKPPFTQYDFPNPRGPLRNPQDWIQRTPQEILSSIVPFAQEDWPNPQPRRYSIDYGSWSQSGLALQSVVATNPLGVSAEYSGPVFAKDLTYVGATLLGSPIPPLSVVQNVPARASIFDTVPQKGTIPPGFVSSSPVTLGSVQAPFFRVDWPNPRGASRGNQDWTQRTYQGILSSIVPFRQTEWPVPKGAKSVEGIANSGLALQSAVVVYPASITFDWPNPRGYQYPVSLRTWADSFKLPLTTVKGTNQYDWPNPTRSVDRRADWIRSTPYTLTAVVAQNPFRQSDWQNPRGVQTVPWLYKYEDHLTIFEVPSFINYDWPNPRGYQPLNRGWIDSFKLPLSAAPVVNVLGVATEISGPVIGLDQSYVRSATLGSPLSVLTSAVTTYIPARGIVFDTPQRQAWLNLGWTDNLKLTLATVVAAPFNQTDWPVPRAAVSFDLRGWKDSFKLPLTTVAPPYIQRDWPVPRGAKPKVQDWQWLNLPILSSAPIPFHQTDWPVPKGYQRNPDWKDSFKLPLTTVRAPYLQTDWPVPRGHGPRQSFTQTYVNFATFVPPAKPFLQTDWPNPLISLKLRITYEFPASQNFWPPTPPIPPIPPEILPRAKHIKTIVSGPLARSQVTGPGGKVELASSKGQTQVTGGKGKTQVKGPKGRTDASDP